MEGKRKIKEKRGEKKKEKREN